MEYVRCPFENGFHPDPFEEEMMSKDPNDVESHVGEEWFMRDPWDVEDQSQLREMLSRAQDEVSSLADHLARMEVHIAALNKSIPWDANGIGIRIGDLVHDGPGMRDGEVLGIQVQSGVEPSVLVHDTREAIFHTADAGDHQTPRRGE